MLQHRWTAESGRSVGGVVNVITKSGTNQLRGSTFGSYRGDGHAGDGFLRAAAPGRRSRRSPRREFTRQEFGGSIGGPIARDQVFFFGALERFRERSNNVVTQTAFNQLQADSRRARCCRRFRRPYDDTLLTAKVDWQMSGGPEAVRALRLPGSVLAQRPDPGTGDVGPEQRQHEHHDQELRLRGRSHTSTIGSNRLNQSSFHYQDFNNADPAERHRRALPRLPLRGHRARTPTRRSRRLSGSISSATTSRSCSAARTALKCGHELHLHADGRLLLLRRFWLHRPLVRRSADRSPTTARSTRRRSRRQAPCARSNTPPVRPATSRTSIRSRSTARTTGG